MGNKVTLTKPEISFLIENNVFLESAKDANSGLSNQNYILNGNLLFKASYDAKFNIFTPEKAAFQNRAAASFLSTKFIAADYAAGFSLSEYRTEFKPLEPSTASIIQLQNTVKALLSLHKINPDVLKEINYEKMLDSYRLLCPIKERKYVSSLENSPLLQTEKEVTHFDLTSDNILADKMNYILFIDFEFVCLAPKYFDLISLLYESDFPKEKRALIKDEYFQGQEEDKADFLSKEPELRALADLLWYHWAYSRSLTSLSKFKKSYESIAQDKLTSLKAYLISSKK